MILKTIPLLTGYFVAQTRTHQGACPSNGRVLPLLSVVLASKVCIILLYFIDFVNIYVGIFFQIHSVSIYLYIYIFLTFFSSLLQVIQASSLVTLV